MITKDKEGNMILTDNAPAKAYQNSQRVTEQLTALSNDVGRLSAENKALKQQLEREAKEITVTLKDSKAITPSISSIMFGGFNYSTPGSSVIESIKVKNVDEVDKFLTSALESEIAEERDELKGKYDKLELKLDEKDSEINKLNRELKRLKENHSNEREDLFKNYEKELNLIRKTAKGKIEKQLVTKDVEYLELKNNLELERQEATLRETDLLGKLEYFKQANTALENEVARIKAESPKLLGTLGNYINKMMGYKKAVKELDSFKKRNIRGTVNPFITYY